MRITKSFFSVISSLKHVNKRTWVWLFVHKIHLQLPFSNYYMPPFQHHSHLTCSREPSLNFEETSYFLSVNSIYFRLKISYEYCNSHHLIIRFLYTDKL